MDENRNHHDSSAILFPVRRLAISSKRSPQPELAEVSVTAKMVGASPRGTSEVAAVGDLDDKTPMNFPWKYWIDPHLRNYPSVRRNT